MFDSYCLNLNDTVNPDSFTKEYSKAKDLFSRYCFLFGLSPTDFAQKGKGGVIAKKAINGVNLSIIRQCFIHYCRNNLKTVGVVLLGKIVGNVDHTSVCAATKKANDYLVTKDEKFISYYDTLLTCVENPV